MIREEMLQRISSWELTLWQAYFKVLEEERAAEEAKQGNGPGKKGISRAERAAGLDRARA